jgi:hypothetical protein
MKLLFLLLYVSANTAVVFSQTVNMDVLMGVKNIGHITAQKKITGKTVNAALSSKVSVSFLIKVNVEQTIVSEYKDGKLMKADVVRVSNISSENKKTAINWNGSEYTILKDSVTITHKDPVTYCVLDLYFTEPVGLTKVFGETGGTYMPIKSLGNHQYELQVNDSKRDIFTYGDDGKLMQVESVIAMKKVTFKVK